MIQATEVILGILLCLVGCRLLFAVKRYEDTCNNWCVIS
jgi:hypothetical protein